MENNGMMVVEPGRALAHAKGRNYEVSIGQASVVLQRNEDFMKLPKTKRPTLLKSGAEKLQMAYQLRAEYVLLNDHATVLTDSDGKPWMNYEVRCSLFAGDVRICDGVGAANTREKSSGFASDYDMSNKAFKVAKKRALVDAIITVTGLGGMFKHDLEDDDLEKDSKEIVEAAKPGDPITSKQMTRLYAIAGQHGRTRDEAKQIIIAAGYTSSRDIKQKDYDKICDMMAKEKDE